MKKNSSLGPLRKYRFKVFLAPVLKLVEVATELFSPFLVRFIIDDGIKKGTDGDLALTLELCGAMLGLAILGFGATMLAQYLAARVSADYGYDLRQEIYHHLNLLSEKDLDHFGKQKVLTLVNNDSFSLSNGVMMFMRLVLRPPFLLLGSTILSFIISVKAGFIFLGAITLSAMVIALVMAVAPKKYAAIQSNLDEISTFGSDSLKGARPVRAFNKQDYEEEKFGKSIENYQKKSMGMAVFNSLINPLTFCFINLGMVLIVYLGRDGLKNGDLTVGEVVSLISYLVSSLAALVMWSRMIVSINKAAASKKRIDAFFAIEPSLVSGSEAITPLKKGDELVRFEDVSLSYGAKTDKPAVAHLSFKILKGQSVGLIGGTGSGKSTTLALLERLYDPSEGAIFYEGKPLSVFSLEALHNDISLVSQKPALFKGTVRSNLLLGKKDASEDEMIQALKDSLAYEYVSKYPDFLEHPIEEGGANLSGGQKQRLLIARAFLKGGGLLVLDDSTSALDFLSDEKVRENIRKKSDLTSILVSQRASSLSKCDLILVYDNGAIVAQGKHEELIKTCPIYRDIYEMQRQQA